MAGDLDRLVASLEAQARYEYDPYGQKTLTDAAATITRLREAEETWLWLAEKVNLELSWGEPDGDPSECCWRVHRCTGNRNDREWDLIGVGETPLEAVASARQALGGEQ